MGTTVSVEDAGEGLAQLLERAHGGEEIVIVKAGQPYARLVPPEAAGMRLLGFVDAPTDDLFFEPLPDDELAAWG